MGLFCLPIIKTVQTLSLLYLQTIHNTKIKPSLQIKNIKENQQSQVNPKNPSQSDPHPETESLQVEIPLIVMIFRSPLTIWLENLPFLTLIPLLTVNGQELKRLNTKEPSDSWKWSKMSILKENLFWTITTFIKLLKTSKYEALSKILKEDK